MDLRLAMIKDKFASKYEQPLLFLSEVSFDKSSVENAQDPTKKANLSLTISRYNL
jgi:hypothetical protein